MSWRGAIIVECDSEDCYAETVLQSGDLDNCTVNDRLNEDGWQDRQVGKAWQWICPQCVEEAEKAAQEQDDHERAAARARSNDFADTKGRDWT